MHRLSLLAEADRLVKVDPPVRCDGLCAVCLGPRKVPKGTWAREAARLDPFCSSTCARAWHGVSLTRGLVGSSL